MEARAMYHCFATLFGRFSAVSLFLLLCALPTRAQNLPGWFQELLQKQINVTQDNLAGLERGGAVTRMLKTREKKEVAALGLVRVDISGDLFVEKFRDIVNFKKSAAVLQIGKFSIAPRLEDLKDLTLDPCCLKAIKNCEPGKCGMKMSLEMMERFRKEFNPSAPDSAQRANALARRILFDYVQAYLQVGNPSLIEYHDQGNLVRLAHESRSLLEQSRFLADYAPEFYKYLEEFPTSGSPNIDSFIYWSKEKYGLKPVLSVTHVTIFKRTLENRTEVLIASKQLYANHYFEGSLGLTIFVEGNQGPATSRSYLMYLNRSRADALQGMFIGLKRSVIGARVRDGLAKNLILIKRRLEGYKPQP
jgi:hypothetical protein